jgi:hypothetical protein
MNKLWVFGDSFSEPFSKIMDTTGFGYRSKYNKWKGYISKSYGDIISEKLNLLHFNKAGGGNDNYTIFDSIIHSLEKINKDDVIIIGWSNTIRFRVVGVENSFKTIRPHSLSFITKLNKYTKNIDLSDKALQEISLNRDSVAYINELNNYIKLLNFSFNGNKIIHWSPFSQDTQGLNTNLKTSVKYELIKDETNGFIDDGHFSENAHKVLSEQLIDIIDNYNFTKLSNASNFLI